VLSDIPLASYDPANAVITCKAIEIAGIAAWMFHAASLHGKFRESQTEG